MNITFVYKLNYIVLNLIIDIFIYHFLVFLFVLQQHYRTVSGHAVWQIWTDSTEESLERQADGHASGCSVCQVSISLVFCFLSLFLGLFAGLRKVTLSFVMSVSVCWHGTA